MTKKYVMLKPRMSHKAGTLVYKATGHDYGLARDDTNYTGVEHISVTLDENGGYPFFTIPREDLMGIIEGGTRMAGDGGYEIGTNGECEQFRMMRGIIDPGQTSDLEMSLKRADLLDGTL